MSTMHRASEATPFRYSGHFFTQDEIEVIRRITKDPRYTMRAEIVRAVCEALQWKGPDGKPKLVSCHVALKRMEAHGIIWLPLPTREPPSFRRPTFTPASDPQLPIVGSRGDLQDLRLGPVTAQAHRRLWNELLERYHYLGGRPMASAPMGYLAYDGDRGLAALGFGAAAWKATASSCCPGSG